MGQLKIDRKARNRHFGFFGTNGSGKTNSMMSLFAQTTGKKIIIDVTGDYWNIFAQEKDMLFCPFIDQSVRWNIFSDVKTQLDVVNIATALIPNNSSTRDPFWDAAARTIVEAVVLYLAKRKGSKNRDIWEILTDFERLQKIKDEDEDVKRLIDNFTQEHDTKLTTQVLATVITKQEVRALQYLSFIEGDFSFREWVKNEWRQNSLYLIANEKLQNVLLPIYRVIIDLFSEELLDLPSDERREVTFFLDEFPKMGAMNRIIDLLALARKKGGGVAYAAQSYSQLEKIYGKDALTILNNTNTLFIFRMDKADVFEEVFGKQEVLQYVENISTGDTKIADRIGANTQRTIKSVVIAGEIASLADNEAYIKTIYPGITRVKFRYIPRKPQNDLQINLKNITLSQTEEAEYEPTIQTA